jgi:two-component system sensor histidine kinase ChvG
MVRFDDALVRAALAGADGQHWGQDPDSAIVRNSVAVPVRVQGRVRGAVVMEATTDGLLLVTNRALGRIMFTTLLLTLGLAAGLWFFATRLSGRVQRLSGAVSRAMDESGKPGPLPLTGDRDELGELARNNARLLRAVAEYTAYLQKLAGRLSHELKTPLAITRSSLDNLSSHALDDDARRYVDRAREGLDRQAAIVRAMSEASRLEAAIKASDWDELDLRDVIRDCVEAYRGVHAGRDIELTLPAQPCPLTCAPDLVAQALDKLVDNAVSLTGPNDFVRVSLEQEGPACRVKVVNSGTQLPEVLPEQLFDSLVSMREKGGGRHLGLGLHIVRLVAEAHGGQASARNLDDGEGVEFSIYLPG